MRLNTQALLFLKPTIDRRQRYRAAISSLVFTESYGLRYNSDSVISLDQTNEIWLGQKAIFIDLLELIKLVLQLFNLRLFSKLCLQILVVQNLIHSSFLLVLLLLVLFKLGFVLPVLLYLIFSDLV